MPASATLLLYVLSTAALLAVPGPSVVYVVARAVEHGRAAGLVSVLGLETGALLHVLLAAGGVTAVLASSEWAFAVLRYGGAAYLLWLGVRQLLSRRRPAGAGPAATPASRRRLFRDGVLVDLLNPKTGLFFLAFLPQFVDPAAGPVALQVLVLGLLFVVMATATDSAYALTAAALRNRVARPASGRPVLQRTTAVVYCGLGGLAAVV
ncbi:LysE family translocator [Geodermatophilus sp. SYSU D01106]